MTGRELRAQLRAQLGRNTPATSSASLAAKSCAPEAITDVSAPVVTDPGTERRSIKALGLLADYPNVRRFVIAEAGDPVIIGVAVRDIGYGELEIPAARYDAWTLLELLDEYSGDLGLTVH